MHKHFNKVLLAVAIYICPLTFLSVESKVQHSADSNRLQHAGNLLNAKHYRRGYVSFKNMAQHGCPYSQCILGILNQKGLGVKKSAVRAQYWFQKSAQQGFADAEHRLGLMYYYGDGIKKDLTLAKQWLTRAANHGVVDARELLAQIPGESNVSNQISQAPQQIADSANNIKTAWEGYSEVTKQLNQLSSTGQSN